ncbi:hypothetical protein Tco_1066423 [Tanacetum coccineum]|uniref:Uncharacterized protein n=1 Tax=Tanacetum coccineum TaxID=301880 RepID=A0ABQ5HA05_9ASTR
MKVFTMKMEILLELTSNKLLVGDLCDSARIKLVSTGKKRCYERSHKGVKASANSDIVYFFTSAQDGDPLQDDVRLCLGDDLKKAQDHNQRQVKDESKDHYPQRLQVATWHKTFVEFTRGWVRLGCLDVDTQITSMQRDYRETRAECRTA